MVKKLSRIGGSLGLVIDKPILELYQFESEVEITPVEGGLLIKPLRRGKAAKKAKIKEALEEADVKYNKMLKDLA